MKNAHRDRPFLDEAGDGQPGQIAPATVGDGGASTGRLALVDGMRGYFLALMMSQHLVLTGDTWFRRLHHGELAFVEDAQGFVFLSGLVVGLVYAKTLARQGPAALARKAWSRVGELYRMMLLTIGVLVVCALAVPFLAEAWRPHIGPLVDGSLPHLAGVAAMTLQPAFGDVLPQYMLYLALSPLLVRWAARGHGMTILLWSVTVWFLAQVGVHHVVGSWLVSGAAALSGADGTVHAYFNPMAWQLLFVVGLVIGVDEVSARAQGRASLRERLLRPRPAVFAAAVLIVLVLAVLRILHGVGEIGGLLADNFYRLFRRQDLSLIFAVDFLALAYLVAVLVSDTGQVGVRRVLGRGLRALFSWRFFVFLGQHSLQVYAFHVIVVFAVIAFDQVVGPLHPIAQGALGITAIASLLAAAVWHRARARWQAQRTSRRRARTE